MRKTSGEKLQRGFVEITSKNMLFPYIFTFNTVNFHDIMTLFCMVPCCPTMCLLTETLTSLSCLSVCRYEENVSKANFNDAGFSKLRNSDLQMVTFASFNT